MEKFLLLSASLKQTKRGSDYFDVTLSGKDGAVTGKNWDGTIDMRDCVGKVIEVTGTLEEYNGEPQYNIRSFKVTDEDPSNYCVRSKYDIETMYQHIGQFIGTVTNPELKGILQEIFGKYGEEFKKHSCALKNHHAFVGGLLQHTLCVTNSAHKLCSSYKQADRDVVITAALLHDVGKLREISNFPNLEFTREGACMGHLVMSMLEVAPYLERVTDGVTRDKLANCILAHHGQREWGSPVTPVCIEAWIVHVCDLLDARVEAIIEASERVEAGKLTAYIPSLGGSVIGV